MSLKRPADNDLEGKGLLDLAPSTFAKTVPAKSAIIARRLPAGDSVEISVDYAEINGRAIYQGDIFLGDAAVIERREAERTAQLRSRDYALILNRPNELWPGGVIPFTAEPAVGALVQAAAAHIASLTPLRLRPHAGEADWISFAQSSSNDSAVGRTGGEQVINLSQDCTVGTSVHEICHAYGLWHEQCRPDRDQYVTIYEENIRAGCLVQFAVQKVNAACVGAYDYKSIMHYGEHDFAEPEHALTIKTKNGDAIGQRTGLSVGDIAGLRALYPALSWR